MSTLPLIPITIAERERQREIASYFSAASISPIPQTPGTPIQPNISPDQILTGLAQLGTIRLDANRSFVSLIDGKYQYIIAEATKTVSLKDSQQCDPGDQVYLGTTHLELGWGVCPNAMRIFSDKSGKLAIDSPNIIGDTSRFIIRDFQADPHYSERPYVKGWPYMRCYAEVPLTSPRGYVIGSYCIVDNRLRGDLDDKCVRILTETATAIMEHLENMKTKHASSRSNHLLEGLGMFMDGDTGLNSISRIHQRQRKGLTRICTPNATSKVTFDDSPSKVSSQVFTSPDPSNSSSFVSTNTSSLVPTSDGGDITSASRRGSENVTYFSPLTPGGVPENSFVSRKDGKSSKPVGQPHHPKLARSRSTAARRHSRGKISVVASDARTIFGMASSIIRDAMDITGLVFLDAHPTHLNPAKDPNSTVAQERNAYLSSPKGIDENESQVVCAELARSLSADAADEDTQDEDTLGVSEKLLHRLIDFYPTGHIFCSDDFGLLFDEEEPVMLTQCGLDESVECNSSQKLTDATKLFEIFPGSRSIIFLPLWDVQRDCFFAASFAWTTDFKRLFETKDLTYLTAFGNSISAEVARVEAMRTSKAKSDFISSLSHELRSPLHGILASSELLREALEPAAPPVVHDMVDMIESCGNTLLDTLTNLLDFAKINSLLRPQTSKAEQNLKTPQKVDARTSLKQHVDMSILVQDVVEGVYLGHHSDNSLTGAPNQSWSDSSISSAQTSRVQEPPLVTFHIEKQPSWLLEIDVGVWKRIVMNIVGNALKYTEHGAIQVALRLESISGDTNTTDADAICLEVADTGIGMSSEYQSTHLFKPFAQENSLSPGTGLGLSIVHQLVTSLKGNIEVTSEVGIGTCVKVTAPLAKAILKRNAELPHPAASSIQPKDTLKGRKVCLVLPPSSSSPDENKSPDMNTIQPALTCRYDLATLLTEWFGVHATFDTKIGGTDADLYIIEDSALRSLESPSAVLDARSAYRYTPLLVLCPKPHRGGNRQSTFDGRKVTYMHYPIGPKKMATYLNQAFDRAEVSETIPSTTSLIELLDKQVGAAINGPKLENAVTKVIVEHIREEVCISDLEKSMTEVHVADITFPISTDVEPKPEPKYPSTQHVLCVDDNAINIKVLTTTIKKLGDTFVTAMNGLEGLNAYKSAPKPFTCVFMDINMPVMDGFEATRRIREYERECGLPRCQIVALTGLGSASSQLDALNCGVDMFLTKPVKMNTLRGILSKLKAPQTDR